MNETCKAPWECTVGLEFLDPKVDTERKKPRDPNDPYTVDLQKLLDQRGRLHMHLGRWEEAVADYEEAITRQQAEYESGSYQYGDVWRQ